MKQIKCINCGYTGGPRKMTPGSFLMEVVLWCLLLIPGVIYSIWRISSKYKVCPRCLTVVTPIFYIRDNEGT